MQKTRIGQVTLGLLLLAGTPPQAPLITVPVN